MPGFTVQIDVRQAVKAANDAAKATKRMGTEFRLVAREASQTNAILREISAQAEKTRGGFKNMLAPLKAFMGLLAVERLKAAGEAMLEASLAADRLSKAYEAVFGGAYEADKQLNFIYQTSQRLGLEFMSAAESAKTFFAATQGTELANEAGRIFEAVSTAGSALALGSDQMQGVFLALGQMVSKGKVQAEELRGQLGERLPGAFQLAAEAMGMTTAELDKFMAEGKLTAEQLLPKLADALQDKYAAAAEEASKGMAAAVNRMSTEWERFKASILNSDDVVMVLEKVSGGLKSWNDLQAKQREDAELVRQMNAARIVPLGYETVTNAGHSGNNVSFESRAYFTDEQKAQFKALREEVAKTNAAVKEAARKSEQIITKGNAAAAEFLKDTAISKKASLDDEYQAVVAAIDAQIAEYQRQGIDYQLLLNTKERVHKEYLARVAALDKKANAENLKQAKKAAQAEKDAKEQAAREIETRANLLDEIASMGGSSSLAIEVQIDLIRQQTEALREQYPALGDIISLWEELKIAQTDPNLFFSTEEQVRRFQDKMEGFYKSSMDLGGQLADVTINAFGDMEDALVNFAMTGKLSFTDMVNSMIADLMRLMVRKSITGPLADALGEGIGSLFAVPNGYDITAQLNGFSSANPAVDFYAGMLHSGGIIGRNEESGFRRIPLSVFENAPRFHSGKLPWNPSTELPAVIRKDEGVFTPAQMDALGKSAPAEVYVNIVNSTGEQVQTRTRADNHGNKTIDVYVGEMAAKQMVTPGSALNRAVSAQTGQKRPAIRR